MEGDTTPGAYCITCNQIWIRSCRVDLILSYITFIKICKTNMGLKMKFCSYNYLLFYGNNLLYIISFNQEFFEYQFHHLFLFMPFPRQLVQSEQSWIFTCQHLLF